MIRKYGWKRQAPDERDYHFGAVALALALPHKVDLSASAFMPPVWDQGQIGSCTAHAASAAFMFDQNKQRLSGFDPSRLELYYAERDLDGDTDADGGSTLRTACKTLASVGVCRADIWAYDEAQLRVKPSEAAYADALLHKAVDYSAVSMDMNAVKTVLAAGFPVVFGTNVYESFESGGAAKTGVIVMPQPAEQCLGGHALLLVGYDDTDTDTNHALKFRNSWGASWGQHGYGQFSWEYFLKYASDLWVIRSVERSG
jgi:C1A family cysteine protease